MATSTIKTASCLFNDEKVAFIGCIDNTLKDGHGLITRKGTHYFGSLEADQQEWMPLVGYSKSQQWWMPEYTESTFPVAIGHGHFGIGYLIYKYGTSAPICKASMPIISGSNGACITRILEDGIVLEISCIYCKQDDITHSIKFVRSHIVDGQLVGQQSVCTLVRIHKESEMYYFKGYLILQRDPLRYILINCSNGNECDIIRRRAGYIRKLRLINGGRLMGSYIKNPEYNEDIKKVIEVGPDDHLECTLDVQGDKFVVTNASNYVGAILDIFDVRDTRRIGFNENHAVSNTIVAVNFSLKCCLAEAFLVPGHPGCYLLNTNHLDTYGIAYLPTRTVIKLRTRPIFCGNSKNTPEVVETLISHGGSTLAVVVKSMGAFHIPTWNHQVVVINTVTGKYNIAYCRSTGSDHMDGATPKLLYVEDDNAVVFQVYDNIIKQPIFNAHIDAMAIQLVSQLDRRLPMEIALLIASYMD